MEPVSRADPSYPEAMRKTLWSLKPGEISPPVLMDNQYAVIMLVKEIPGDDVTFEDVRAEMDRFARLEQERVLMDRLARSLMTDISVTIFDESLKDTWDRTRSRGLSVVRHPKLTN